MAVADWQVAAMREAVQPIVNFRFLFPMAA